jgi:hypothetical protein
MHITGAPFDLVPLRDRRLRYSYPLRVKRQVLSGTKKPFARANSSKDFGFGGKGRFSALSYASIGHLSETYLFNFRRGILTHEKNYAINFRGSCEFTYGNKNEIGQVEESKNN